jgi:hypothetical protein
MIFDDWKSIVHFLIGFAACFVSKLSILSALLLAAIFIIYQLIESKTFKELLSDVLEFCIGYALCCVILYFFRLDPYAYFNVG